MTLCQYIFYQWNIVFDCSSNLNASNCRAPHENMDFKEDETQICVFYEKQSSNHPWCVICKNYQDCVCVMKAWPYCVLAVSIDQLQQLALELLQGRLKGDGKSVQGEGQRFERLRLQQSISWWQREHNIIWHTRLNIYTIFLSHI